MDNDLEYLMNEIKADQKPVKPKRRRKRRRGGAFLILVGLGILYFAIK